MSSHAKLGIRRPRHSTEVAAQPDFYHYTNEEANRLFGGYTREGETLDAEFVEEPAPEQPMFKPEWAIWLRWGQEKFDDATKYLRFVKTEGNVHHYVDVRDGLEYSVPVQEELDRYERETEELRVKHAPTRRFWAITIRVAWCLLPLLVYLAAVLSEDHDSVSRGLTTAALLLLFIGMPMLYLFRTMAIPSPRTLPFHHMFSTDAEVEEFGEREHRRDRRNAVIGAGVLAWGAWKIFHDDDRD